MHAIELENTLNKLELNIIVKSVIITPVFLLRQSQIDKK